jgi:hypothetical protein
MYCMKPFNRWHMPLPEQIKFVIDQDENMGTYLYDDGEKYEHIITISEKKCGHLSTVIRVLAHEAVHMSRWKTNKWTHHDAEFRRRTKVVSEELGFDPLEL